MSFKYTDEHLKSQLGIILLIKLIWSFIRKARPANVGKIEYFGERYTDRSNYCFDPKFDEWKSQANFKYSTIRDKYLRRYFNESGATIDVNSGDRASLPHWRSLEVSNGKSTLVIYPDGGVANGWYADPLTEDVNGNKAGLTITLKEKIKFDIELK